MLKKLLFGAVFFILVSGCGTNSETRRSQNWFNNDVDNAYSVGKSALKRYSTKKDCNSSDANVVKQSITSLEKSESFVNNLHYNIMNYYNEKIIRDYHTNLAFEFADESIKNSCLDNADNTYRQLISFYVGEAYSGIRDRAKLGVDDVRNLRSKK